MNNVVNNALWGGRFESGPDAAMARFSTSLPFDSRLWRYDIQGSIAHVTMLEQVQVLASDEADQIRAGLMQIYNELNNQLLGFENAPDEDIHSFIERELTSRIGSVAGKLHTARSRNDQIALDVRLYLKDALTQTKSALKSVLQVLADRADEQFGAVLPGYTHLQRAQPVLLSHHLLAYFQMFARDVERIDECFARADVLPLGAAAMAGTTFPIDRHLVAQQLNFARVSENSMDTVADRDHLIESTQALSIIALHLSRLAEEWVLWSAPEWGFIALDDRFSTGSSIMPQKKNPDSMELIRGKTARVCASANTLTMLVKGLPLTYNRDLQEDKEPLFDAFDTVLGCLEIARGVLETTRFHTEQMRASAGGGFSTATDVADYLVRLGIPFREAHEITGHAVKFCEDNHLTLEEVSLEQWQTIDARIENGIFAAVDVDNSVAARTSYGGTAPERVREQLERAREVLVNL